MITEIKLANFKAFGDGLNEEPRTAPMSKITLIYGQNSSGKSSLVQSLLLLKQSVEDRIAPARLAATGQYCDVGNFNAAVHHHDIKNRHINIAVRYRTPSECMTSFEICGDQQNQLRLNRYVHKRGGVLGPDFEVDLTEEDLNGERPLFGLTDAFTIENLADFLSHRQGRLSNYGLIRDEDKERFIDLAPHMFFRPRNNNLIPNQRTMGSDTTSLNELIRETGERIDAISAELDAYSSRRTQVRLRKEAERLSLRRALDYIRSPQGRAGHARMDEAVNVALRDASNDVVEGLLAKIAYLGPVRNAPQRVYRDSSVRSRVGVNAEHIYSVLSADPVLVRCIDRYFKDFDIPYKLSIHSDAIDPNLGANVGIIGLEGTETRSKTIHSLVDVGFGISQILPTIVEGMAGAASIICVDEPEVHMHPRLQAHVADFLIDTAVRSDNPKQWIVETHSELLARRIQTRMSQGRLSPDDVSVLYVDPPRPQRTTKAGIDMTSSYIIPIRLDSEGDWRTRWPEGFFAESSKEIMKMLAGDEDVY